MSSFQVGIQVIIRKGNTILLGQRKKSYGFDTWGLPGGHLKFGESFEAMRRHLRYSQARRSLVGAINDPSALGALRAFQEAGRTDSCAVMGQNASPEGRAELRAPGTRLVGSVAYFPEKYGAEIVAVALDILHRRAVPPAVFVKHQLVTPDTVNHIYPNDELMMRPGLSA